MDDATLAGLRAALDATPDNAALLQVIAQAHLDRGEPAEASSLVQGRDPSALPDTLRLLVARASLDADSPEAVDALAPPGPEGDLLRARASVALEDGASARRHYAAAISANAVLEDTDLDQAIRALEQADRTVDAGPTRLRVLSGGGSPDDEVVSPGVQASRETVTFEDVGGLDDLKKKISRRVILPIQKPGLFKRFRRKAGGGILLYGPPGCGKTLLARAIAGECGFPFFDVRISDILDMWIGASEQRLAGIFDTARAHRPAVIFFDEVEALGGQRRHNTNATMANLVSQFLNELDGFSADNDGLLVLGATNLPWAVDAAFRRPGRFDRVIFVPPPDRAARAAILRIHLRDRPVAADVDVDALARRTSGFSGADLQNLVETAIDEAIAESLERDAEVPLGRDHLDEALDEVKPTTTEWLTTARSYARYSNEGGQYDDVLAFLKRHGR